MGTQLPRPKGAQPPIFGPYLLRSNGCMDQDATWYGGRPPPRRLCVRFGSRSPSLKRGRSHPPKFRPMFILAKRHGWIWIKMVLHMEVGLSTGDFVRWAPCPSTKRAPPPKKKNRSIFITTKRVDGSRWHLAWRPQPRRLCARWGPSPHP